MLPTRVEEKSRKSDRPAITAHYYVTRKFAPATFPMPFSHLLDLADDYLKTAIAPQANPMDGDTRVLQEGLSGLGKRQLLALRVPQSLGGAGLDTKTFYRFQTQVARFSGALAFLQTQHQSAANLLAQSPNADLKKAYLPYLGNGQKLVGVGFSHLRRSPSPLQAIAVPGGYQLTGQVPWVTGYGLFEAVLLAATLPDGQAVYGLVPFQSTQQATGGSLRFSDPMSLAAMTSTYTVTAELHDWHLPTAQVALLQPADAILTRDRHNILNPSAFALGCAQAGLDVLANQAQSLALIKPIWTSLQAELDRGQQQITAGLTDSETEPDLNVEKLRLRAWAIDLMARCTQAAVIASSGAANSSHHPAQRLYREALMFSVAGQTTDIMAATLANLVRES